MKILQIKSSILGENSVSSKYTDKLVAKLKKDKDIVVIRDVAKNTVTQLSGEVLADLSNPDSKVSKEHNELIEEIKSSDVIVLASPMYNFTIPATLKNYFDAITKAGVTFKYNSNGQPEGLVKDKKAYVVISRGGKYKESNVTFQEDYIKLQLGFIGITDVKFIFLEGVATGATESDLTNSFNSQLN